MKFSIVIPVYNVEKYLRKCLDSVLNQTYRDFEVIIVNDESPDNSQSIIDEYVKKDDRFKCYNKKNGGLSDARNFGLQYITGDYLIFLDSDDYIEKDLLIEISRVANGYDIIKYNLKLVDEDGKLIRKAKSFSKNGKSSFKDLINVEFFQPAWSYAYNIEYWKENNFKYEVGRIHEDFGLTPLCALLAKKIYLLNYYGYNYVQRTGSIMNGATKTKKRAYDILYHFDNLNSKLNSLKNINEENKKICLSFIANSVIYISTLLNKEERQLYLQELKKRKISNYLLDDTFERKIKKILAKISLEGYIKVRFNI